MSAPDRLPAAVWRSAAFAAVCAIALLAAVAAGLASGGYPVLPRTATLLLVLAVPPALVAGLAALALDTAVPDAGALPRGVAMALVLSTAGPIASAATFALVYRLSYPGWVAPLWSRAGLHDLFWGGVSSVYLFLIAGPRLYLPWGPVAVLALSLLFAARRPPALRQPAKSVRDPAIRSPHRKER